MSDSDSDAEFYDAREDYVEISVAPLSPPPKVSLFPALNSPQRAAASAGLLAPTATVPTLRKKAILEHGHSSLDWANLKGSYRPTGDFRSYTAEQVKKHRRMNDVWTILHGKVYDVTLYVPFHPGGKKELFRGAGSDCTALFMEVHPWVNVDFMLDKFCIGYLKG